MLLYQITVSGRRDWVDGLWNAASKRLFRTREAAETYQPEFIRKVTTPEYPGDLRVMMNDESLKVRINELELDEDL